MGEVDRATEAREAMTGRLPELLSHRGTRNQQRTPGGLRWTALLEVVVVFGVWVGVVWHCFCYNPRFAIGTSLPRGHRLFDRVEADLDGDGRKEVIFTSGEDSAPYGNAGPAALTVFRWRSWRWRRAWCWSDVDDPGTIPGDSTADGIDAESLRADDINGDGHKEIIFRYIYRGASDHWTRFRVFGCRNGRYVCLAAAPFHAAQGGALVKDLDAKYRGKEILSWTFLWEDDAHHAPHRYYATFLRWETNHYRPYKWVETKQKLSGEQAVLRALLNPSAVIVRSKPRSEDKM